MGLWDKVKGKANDFANTAKTAVNAPGDRPFSDESDITVRDAEAPSYALEDDTMFDGAPVPRDAGDGGDAPDGSDDWGGWDPNDVDAFWDRVHAIEAAGNQGDDELEAALHQHGLRDKAHFDRVRDTFGAHHGSSPDFAQAALDARTRQTKHAMKARMEGSLKGELAPVEGASLEQWAWVMAKMASGGDIGALLKTAGWDRGKWDRVSAEWNARMSRDTTATIATAYGQAFVATGAGPFGAAGKASAASMLDASQRDVGGQEPIPFERWIEITEAQSAASQQGIPAAQILQSYGLTPADWGTIGGWWSQRFNANAMKLINEYNRLSEKYKAKFARGFPVG